MAAPKLHKAKSATFAAAAIVHAVSVSIAVEGSEQMARGDGAVAMQIAFMEGVFMRVVVNALEGSHADGLILPAAGALVTTLFEQASGAGEVGAGTKIYTFPEATFKGVKRGAPLDGVPSLDYEFICVAASGVAADIFAVT